MDFQAGSRDSTATIEVIRLFLTDTDHDDYIITLTTTASANPLRELFDFRRENGQNYQLHMPLYGQSVPGAIF